MFATDLINFYYLTDLISIFYYSNYNYIAILVHFFLYINFHPSFYDEQEIALVYPCHLQLFEV
jgi:hypothetical protein